MPRSLHFRPSRGVLESASWILPSKLPRGQGTDAELADYLRSSPLPDVDSEAAEMSSSFPPLHRSPLEALRRPLELAHYSVVSVVGSTASRFRAAPDGAIGARMHADDDIALEPDLIQSAGAGWASFGGSPRHTRMRPKPADREHKGPPTIRYITRALLCVRGFGLSAAQGARRSRRAAHAHGQ